jgi:hypothetical protein
MQKKLTISIDQAVYDGLHAVIGPRNISRFLADLARPHVVPNDLAKGYAEMAADKEREKEALEWSEGLLGCISDESR